MAFYHAKSHEFGLLTHQLASSYLVATVTTLCSTGWNQSCKAHLWSPVLQVSKNGSARSVWLSMFQTNQCNLTQMFERDSNLLADKSKLMHCITWIACSTSEFKHILSKKQEIPYLPGPTKEMHGSVRTTPVQNIKRLARLVSPRDRTQDIDRAISLVRFIQNVIDQNLGQRLQASKIAKRVPF